jgi:predicted solute-binding protein
MTNGLGTDLGPQAVEFSLHLLSYMRSKPYVVSAGASLGSGAGPHTYAHTTGTSSCRVPREMTIPTGSCSAGVRGARFIYECVSGIILGWAMARLA